jgi:thymidylate synthase ThyX
MTIAVIKKEPKPNWVTYQAMHNDYSENGLVDEDPKFIQGESEEFYGKIIVKRLLNNNRGHYGCLEHVHILLEVDYRYVDEDLFKGLVNAAIVGSYVSINIRHFLRLLDLTSMEIHYKDESLHELLLKILSDWTPEIAKWYKSQRMHKPENFKVAP